MRIHVNLATRPFVELRPFFLRLRVLMGLLAAVAVVLAIFAHIEAKKLREEKAEMDRTHAAIVATQQQKNAAERRMGLPENAAVLERARFLNGVFLRKSFSWTAVMMDLETVLPLGVQVTSIEPVVTAEGDVTIRLRVSGERDHAVQLVRNLERSRRFLHPRLAAESSQAKEGANGVMQNSVNGVPAGVEFEIMADYNPLPATESYHFAKVREEAMPAAVPAGVIQPQAPSARPTGARDGVVLRPYPAQNPHVSATAPAAAQPSPQTQLPQQPQQSPNGHFMRGHGGGTQ